MASESLNVPEDDLAVVVRIIRAAMSDLIQMCTECLSSNVDGMFDRDCVAGGFHHMVDAVVTDCPFTRRDKRGVFRLQWRKEANRLCQDEAHHYRISAHVKLPDQVGEPG